MRPRALDLFCGAGGASMGLHRAGFDVVGVDLQPFNQQIDLFGAGGVDRYPFEFHCADAMTFDLRGFDLVWASPPCQKYSAATRQSGDPEAHPDLIAPIRARLRENGVPYIIENVLGAPLIDPVMLCGSMFGLRVVRHRLFECSFPVGPLPLHEHKGSLVTGEYVTVAGTGGVPAWTYKEREKMGMPRYLPGEYDLATWQAAMGIDWMSRERLVQAIPPAYSEFLGRAALASMRRAA